MYHLPTHAQRRSRAALFVTRSCLHAGMARAGAEWKACLQRCSNHHPVCGVLQHPYHLFDRFYNAARQPTTFSRYGVPGSRICRSFKALGASYCGHPVARAPEAFDETRVTVEMLTSLSSPIEMSREVDEIRITGEYSQNNKQLHQSTRCRLHGNLVAAPFPTKNANVPVYSVTLVFFKPPRARMSPHCFILISPSLVSRFVLGGSLISRLQYIPYPFLGLESGLVVLTDDQRLKERCGVPPPRNCRPVKNGQGENWKIDTGLLQKISIVRLCTQVKPHCISRCYFPKLQRLCN